MQPPSPGRRRSTPRARPAQRSLRRPLSWRATVLAALLGACGGEAVIDGAAGGGGAGETTTSTTGTTTSTSGQGGGVLTITLSNVLVNVGCKPGLDLPDPVDVSFDATYDNGSSASANATLVGATLSFGGPPVTLDWAFQVSPSSVGPIAGNSSLLLGHAKVEGSGSGGGEPCEFCSMPSPLLAVDYLVDGQLAVVVTAGSSLGCAK
jgi:hypothetical protein